MINSAQMRLRLRHTSTGHRAALYALAPGRTARHVLSAGGDGWITEWDLDAPETGRVIATVPGQIFSLLSLSESRLVAGDMNGGLHWIDLATPDNSRDVPHHRTGVYDLLALSEWVLSAGGDGALTRWDAATGRPVESLQLSGQALRVLAFSPLRNELALGSSDHAIYLLDAGTLALKRVLTAAHDNSVFAVAYSPDGRYLLSGGRDAMLRVWDLEKDLVLCSEQAAHWFTLNHLVFSPDGCHFATASRDKTIKIWETESFSLLKVLDTIRDGGHINSVNRLLWLPDCLVSCSDDRTVKIWEMNDK